MSHDASYHRSFVPDNTVDLSPDDLKEMDPTVRRIIRAGQVAQRQMHAFTVVGRRLAWLWVKKKRDQDFARYATPFEKEFSKILDPASERGLDPIVDGCLTVVAHVGRISGSRLWAPRGTSYRHNMTLNLTDCPIFGSLKSPGGSWVSVGASEERFHVVTRVDGLVLAESGVEFVGVEAEEFWLLDAIIIGKALGELAVGIGRKMVKSYISRASRKVVVDALDGPTAAIAEEFITKASKRTTLSESKGAIRPGTRTRLHTDPFTGETHPIMATAKEKSSVVTSIRAEQGEAEAYKEVLKKGEIGLQCPTGANVSGTDFITVTLDPTTKKVREVIVTDVKTTTVGKTRAPTTTIPGSWRTEVDNAVAVGRLDLGDPVIEAEIRAAVAQNRVRLRQINVDYSPEGQGRISGL